MIEGTLKTERVFMGHSILRKTDRTLSKGEDVVACLPGARIEHVIEQVEIVSGHGQGGSIFVHLRDEQRENQDSIEKKKTRVEQFILL